MKIEVKLVKKNLKSNKKRTIFTIISLILCTMLIFVNILTISSIKDGIAKNLETEYNDYHFIIKNIDADSLSKIKNKEYIDKIYIEENNELKKLEKSYDLTNENEHINLYIKYKNVKKVCNYSNDIIYTLDLSDDAYNKCEFNQKLLTAYGLIDLEITVKDDVPVCRARINYFYVIDIIIVVLLVGFSALFIIVLYNAFLITINERKKEYAVLNSIGATESQILKMIFLEGIIMGTIGIIIGGIISILIANFILKLLNNILINTIYTFKLVFNIKYIVLSFFIILFNIYISSIIPSVKASTTSIMEEIKSNKHIKCKKKETILDKILPIEGKIAVKNIRRNKNKYRLITTLLLVCMTLYITVSTYINYEKESAKLVNEYDIDAEIHIDSSSNINYKSIFDTYQVKYGNEIKYMQYKKIGAYVLVEPDDALIHNSCITTYKNGKKGTQMLLIGLDNKTYSKYIKKINANYGDYIIYNNVTEKNNNISTYSYYPVLKEKSNLKLSIIATYYNYENNIAEYNFIDNESLNGKFILTDELIDGYREIKTTYLTPTIFMNMDTYNKIEEKFNNYIPKNKNETKKWIFNDTDATSIKIKCKNIVQFSNYIENNLKNQNDEHEIDIEYYTLKEQEKIIYINIIQLILRVVISVIVIIGVVSTINIINASLCERKQEFKTLYSIGATKCNINKILIYESMYTFIKAVIISIILSIPILILIIKYMQNVIILNKLLIPFGKIVLFFTILLLIFIIITLCSSKSVKQK